MTKEEFDIFIKKQAQKVQQATVDWNEQLEEWKAYLDRFYERVESLLRPYLDDKSVDLSYSKKTLVEEFIGEYEVRAALISFGGNKIRLDPIGTNLIAAKGRVDMVGPGGTVRFVLVDAKASAPTVSVRISISGEDLPPGPEIPEPVAWEWKIATKPPRIGYLPMAQEEFFQALTEVANG